MLNIPYFFTNTRNQAISLSASFFNSVSLLNINVNFTCQGSLPAPTSRCAGSREQTRSVSPLWSSVPGAPDVFTPVVQASKEETPQESSHGSVFSNSALVAGNVSVSVEMCATGCTEPESTRPFCMMSKVAKIQLFSFPAWRRSTAIFGIRWAGIWQICLTPRTGRMTSTYCQKNTKRLRFLRSIYARLGGREVPLNASHRGQLLLVYTKYFVPGAGRNRAQVVPRPSLFHLNYVRSTTDDWCRSFGAARCDQCTRFRPQLCCDGGGLGLFLSLRDVGCGVRRRRPQLYPRDG